MSTLLPPRKRRLLVLGYIRQKIDIYTPIDLENVCYRYYNDIIDWTLKDNELEQFFNTKFDEFVYGPIFNVNLIPFQLIAYPNGCSTSNNEGYINIYIQLLNDKLSENICNFHIYAHLFCSAVNVEWKKPMTLRYLNRTSHKRSGWFRYNMKLEDYKQYKLITFCCYTELIDIKYINNDHINCINPENPISMNVKYVYEWNINDNMLNAFKTASAGQCYYSPNFNNNCWCIVVIPKGRINDETDSMRVFVKLLKAPNNIYHIEFECTLNIISQIQQNTMQYTLRDKLGYIKRQNVASKTLYFTPKPGIYDNKLSIKASMEIKDIFKSNDIIHKTDWYKFNMIECDD